MLRVLRPTPNTRRYRFPSLSIFIGAMILAAHLESVAFSAEDKSNSPTTKEHSPEAIEFFEKEVRPRLIQHCYECHSAKKQEGSLRLDSAAAVLKGTDEGPVVVPGKPDESKLIKAIRHSGELKMPEKQKLPDVAIAALTKWVELGVPWPVEKTGKSPDPLSPEAAAKTHWAFQPVTAKTPPLVKNETWPSTPLDRFILAKLEEKQLTPAPDADRRTWLRRVSFDLIGLPPTAEEVEAFVHDESAEAFTRTVDRLLASPHFGERWARYWLDLARYADTKGYVFQEDRKYPYAYVYRDWVVKSLNDDLPYDQFVVKQLAADLLPHDTDKNIQGQHDLAALGFLTLGRRFLNNKPDILDDRIDVISRGLLGLTTGCARCHDHKFDPIPMKDYYSTYGVFSPSVEKQVPLEPQSEKYTAELRVREQKVEEFLATKLSELKQNLRTNTAPYLLAAHTTTDPKGDQFEPGKSETDLRPAVVSRWKKYLEQSKKDRPAIFAPWHEFAKLKTDDFATQGTEIAARVVANDKWTPPLNPQVVAAFQGDPPKTLREVADRYAALFVAADSEWTKVQQANEQKDVTANPKLSADWQEIWNVFHVEGTPTKIAAAEGEKFLSKPVKDELRKLRQKTSDWQAGPDAPQQAYVLEEGPVQGNPRVFLRGNAANQGPEVPRQFFAVLSSAKRQPFQKGSGRLEFAHEIASRNNPLTSRVWVNRVWLHLFGNGLIRTPSDFGLRTEPPSHPEMLDDLAHRFIEQGWSTKKLLREIVLSRTYRQSSIRDVNDPATQLALKLDPENRLLSHVNRRRLDLESLRDGLLFASNKLDRAVGGKSVEIAAVPYSNRRTIYGHIDRQNLPGLFRTFDFAGPDAHNPQRFVTTVPQQALFLMNSPFALDQAKGLAARPEITAATDSSEKIQRLYAICFGRPATEDEVNLARAFLEASGAGAKDEKLSPLERLAQALLVSNEFVFLD